LLLLQCAEEVLNLLIEKQTFIGHAGLLAGLRRTASGKALSDVREHKATLEGRRDPRHGAVLPLRTQLGPAGRAFG
jgi:hypothetical protein